MKGLIIKDILNLKQQIKTLILILLFFTFIAVQSGNPIYLVTMYIMLVNTMTTTSMAYDDLEKWDVYAQTMPIKKENIVTSKFILLLIFSTIALLVSVILSYLLILSKTNFNIEEFLISSIVIYLIGIGLVSILMTFIYKYGIEKSRIISTVIFAIPLIIIFFLNKLGVSLPSEDQILSIIKIMPIFTFIIFSFSIKISQKIYKSTDF